MWKISLSSWNGGGREGKVSASMSFVTSGFLQAGRSMHDKDGCDRKVSARILADINFGPYNLNQKVGPHHTQY